MKTKHVLVDQILIVAEYYNIGASRITTCYVINPNRLTEGQYV